MAEALLPYADLTSGPNVISSPEGLGSVSEQRRILGDFGAGNAGGDRAFLNHEAVWSTRGLRERSSVSYSRSS